MPQLWLRFLVLRDCEQSKHSNDQEADSHHPEHEWHSCVDVGVEVVLEDALGDLGLHRGVIFWINKCCRHDTPNKRANAHPREDAATHHALAPGQVTPASLQRCGVQEALPNSKANGVHDEEDARVLDKRSCKGTYDKDCSTNCDWSILVKIIILYVFRGWSYWVRTVLVHIFAKIATQKERQWLIRW